MAMSSATYHLYIHNNLAESASVTFSTHMCCYMVIRLGHIGFGNLARDDTAARIA